MNAGISRRIIAMAQAISATSVAAGYVAIAASVLLASMSGSALADTAALATLLLPMMRERGYPLSSSSAWWRRAGSSPRSFRRRCRS